MICKIFRLTIVYLTILCTIFLFIVLPLKICRNTENGRHWFPTNSALELTAYVQKTGGNSSRIKFIVRRDPNLWHNDSLCKTVKSNKGMKCQIVISKIEWAINNTFLLKMSFSTFLTIILFYSIVLSVPWGLHLFDFRFFFCND